MNDELGSLVGFYETSEATREAVAHNVQILRCVRGGLRMAERHRLPFDPRGDYWRRPERRFVVAYLADRWTGRFAPASQLRRFALDLLQHADRSRRDGVMNFVGVQYDLGGGIESICETLAEHLATLPTSRAWDALRRTWPKLSATAAEDVVNFVRAIPNNDGWEPGFARRLPWLGYIEARADEELRRRQAFFFGFANLWTTSNAYVRAGAQAFAPVIQNTRGEALLDLALLWAKGASPLDTGFLTLGRDDPDEQPQDRATYSAVVEVFGFLNLHRAPFYNNRADVYRQWFDLPKEIDAYDLTSRVGTHVREWLAQHPEAIAIYAGLLRSWLDAQLHTRVQMESIESPRVRKLAVSQADTSLDDELLEELSRLADEDLRRLSAEDAAGIALHLLLDAKVYLGPSVVPPLVVRVTPSAGHTVNDSQEPEIITLPDSLRPVGERALAYLRAGLHVLFAGAPGTGKTTLAQFVGYAWDCNLTELPASLPLKDAPLTTVGNSAWSPFHTIGGLLPAGRDAFKPHGGIFIEPASTATDTWRLRNGALVLDEMNRADLDRCIGELYPLLSGSVGQVVPAGIPGVQRIVANPRFRVLATVNDSNLDDIVFPISDGLARRFQRIELQGGTRDDVLAYFAIAEPVTDTDSRQFAALEALDSFLEVARERHLLKAGDLGDRLHFGVAYFALLKAWIAGKLDAPASEATLREQARDLLAASLSTLGRIKQWNEALRAFSAKS